MRLLAIVAITFIVHLVYVFASSQMNLSQRVQRALELHRSGDLASALREYEAVIPMLPPGDVASLINSNAGSIYSINGDYESAKLKFEQAVAAKDNNAQAHFNLAVTLSSKLNLHDKALTHCIKAMKINPKLHKGSIFVNR